MLPVSPPSACGSIIMGANPGGADATAVAGGTLLIQFARAPVVGAVKTRMTPHLSPEQACALHSELVLWTCRTLVDSGYGSVELAVTGATDHPLFQRCRGYGVTAVTRQWGEGLGERMFNALAAGLARHDRVVLVGSDCPSIDRSYLAAALAALERQTLVLGPAEDGGYVLVGARAIRPEMFEGIPWGTDRVYAETARRLRQLNRTWAALPPLADIDRPEDLAIWRALQSA